MARQIVKIDRALVDFPSLKAHAFVLPVGTIHTDGFAKPFSPQSSLFTSEL